MIGLFFGGSGGYSLFVLIANRRGFEARIVYELSILATLFGVSLFVWGIAAPKWLENVVSHFGSRMFLIIALLFIPFAIEVLMILMRGNF